MLLRFSVENWMSFRDQSVLSMTASRERQHASHLSYVAPYKARVLPTSVIYGGNASGKSNLIKALRFAQKFIIEPSKPDSPTGVRTFRLDKACLNRPALFKFELLIGEVFYEYSFGVSASRVTHEQLKKVTSENEIALFTRKTDAFVLGQGLPELQRLEHVYKGTQNNQLFLTNSVSQRVEIFRPVFDWFKDTLIIIDPDTVYGGMPSLTNERHPGLEELKSRLRALDVGILDLKQVKVAPESVVTKDFLQYLSENLSEGQAFLSPSSEGAFIEKEKGKLVAKKLNLLHRGATGNEAWLEMDEESDGTRRLLNLLPAFLMLEEGGQPFVIVVDELDRSMHALLTRSLLDTYLSRRVKASRSQLIFTTHDLTLMDQRLFRRDEMWVTDRDSRGASRLTGFSEYKDVRYDKDIRKSYLQGRMGGIPKIKHLSPSDLVNI